MADLSLGITAVPLAASLLALAWHTLAWRQLRRLHVSPPISPPPQSPPLTLFKSLPAPPTPALRLAIESFLHQLRPGDTLCLGATDPSVSSLTHQWQHQFPALRLVFTPLRPDPATPNPKIRHFRQIAAHAPAGLWLWSDADMTAPPGFVDTLRAAWTARGNARLITTPYLLPDLRHPASLLDAAIAHLQVIPGLILLSRRHPVDFAVGAAALFDSHDFHRDCSWDNLGAALADDHLLGKKLAPVHVVPLPATTPAVDHAWTAAWSHALRWQRTIHHCNPRASLAHGAVLPLPFWTAALALSPSPWTAAAWTGWLVWESAWTALCHRTAGARLSPATWTALPLAVMARSALWLIAWLPGPIRWNESLWPPAWQRLQGWTRLLPALLPWAVWALPLPHGLRGLAALITWWATHARWTRSLKPVDWVFGLGFALQSIFTFPTALTINALLLLMATASLALRTPFTLAYAREEAPPEHWDHPLFHQANWTLTLVWTATFMFNTLWFAMDPIPTFPWSWVPPALALATAALCTKCLPPRYAQRIPENPLP